MLHSHVGTRTGMSLIVTDYLKLRASDPARRFLTYCTACKEETRLGPPTASPSSRRFTHQHRKTAKTPFCPDRELPPDRSIPYFESQTRSPENARVVREHLAKPGMPEKLLAGVNAVLKPHYVRPVTPDGFRKLTGDADSLGLFDHSSLSPAKVLFAALYVGDFRSGRTAVRFRYYRDNLDHDPLLTPFRVKEGTLPETWRRRGLPSTANEANRLIREGLGLPPKVMSISNRTV